MASVTLPKPKTKRLWTYQEMVASLPETNQPVELWNGEISAVSTPEPDHQEIVLNFAQRLKKFVTEGTLGKVYVSPLDVVLTPRRVVQPDVLYIAKERLSIVKQYIDGVPDLAMEVISEGSWQRDRIQKKALYEQSGVKEYWIVDAGSQTIEVFALNKGVYQLHGKATGTQAAKSKLLSGFAVTFKELSS
jgi:Uma2 family endonuclease